MTGLDVPLEQRMSALEYANRVRSYRAQMKKDVKAGRAPYDFFLARGPHDPMLQSMKIHAALVAMPGFREKKADYVLKRAGISRSKTLGGLSPQAWERLYVVLEAYPTVGRRLSEARATVSAP